MVRLKGKEHGKVLSLSRPCSSQNTALSSALRVPRSLSAIQTLALSSPAHLQSVRVNSQQQAAFPALLAGLELADEIAPSVELLSWTRDHALAAVEFGRSRGQGQERC